MQEKLKDRESVDLITLPESKGKFDFRDLKLFREQIVSQLENIQDKKFRASLLSFICAFAMVNPYKVLRFDKLDNTNATELEKSSLYVEMTNPKSKALIDSLKGHGIKINEYDINNNYSQVMEILDLLVELNTKYKPSQDIISKIDGLEIEFDRENNSAIAMVSKSGHNLTIYPSNFNKQSKHGKLVTLVHELSHIKSFQNLNTAQLAINAFTPSQIAPNKEEEISVKAEQSYNDYTGHRQRKNYYSKSADE